MLGTLNPIFLKILADLCLTVLYSALCDEDEGESLPFEVGNLMCTSSIEQRDVALRVSLDGLIHR